MADLNPKEFNPQVTPEAAPAANELRYASDPDPAKEATLPTLDITIEEANGDYESRCKQCMELAQEAFAMTGSWVLFYRVILGTNGVVAKLFPDSSEYQQFLASEYHATLHEMLAAIRSQDQSKADSAEPERMITIRIPRSLHEALQEEAKGSGLSINKLAISKLLLPVNPRFVPEQQGRRRGRKPGPQGTRNKLGSVSNEDAQQPGHTPVQRIDFQHANAVRENNSPAHHWGNQPRG
ncbi:toxin-antitoxin system HicB family antitoxin [Roseiconus lacunae]|uniref:Toxin-antitoxin system HicB family antitoxin n=1 Tax=Roseiconus lacunae TaxID=2605694 RepID=A0ABT7PK13_9BACT|nr:toxin-antitoxin system HicB family antitoxin [Roseiconus lacunae]MDM4016639.1 toxin-antitoxin system HicB family antitoxin [Roseiconus lacunae]